jgi:hypothetical protein
MAEGYLRDRQRGGIEEGNCYTSTFKSLYFGEKGDPALRKILATDQDVRERILRRFKDIDALASGEHPNHIAPIRIFESTLSPGRKNAIKHGEFNQTIYCDAIDGYHRIFWASYLGVQKLDALYLIGDSIAG